MNGAGGGSGAGEEVDWSCLRMEAETGSAFSKNSILAAFRASPFEKRDCRCFQIGCGTSRREIPRLKRSLFRDTNCENKFERKLG